MIRVLVHCSLQGQNYFDGLADGFPDCGISVVTQISSSLHSYVNLSYSLKSLPTLKLLVISQRTFRIVLVQAGQFIKTLYQKVQVSISL